MAVQAAVLADTAFQLEQLSPQRPAVGLEAVLSFALAAQQTRFLSDGYWDIAFPL